MGKRIPLEFVWRPLPKVDADVPLEIKATIHRHTEEAANHLFTKGVNAGGDDSLIKPKRGRPKTTTPEQRKEYLAQKARDRRAKHKAES